VPVLPEGRVVTGLQGTSSSIPSTATESSSQKARLIGSFVSRVPINGPALVQSVTGFQILAVSTSRNDSVTPSTAPSNDSALVRDGGRSPLTLRMNWRAVAWISSSVARSSRRRNV